MTNKETIEFLVKTNNKDYQIDKALEELSELTTALLQFKNKPKNPEPKIKAVIEEIGDVKIRLEILEEIFNKKKVLKRYNYKLNRFKYFIKKQLYIGRI